MKEIETNHFLRNVYEHEEQRIIRLAKDYEELYHREQEEENSRAKDQRITKGVMNTMNKEKKERWQGKAQHSYLFRKSQENQTIDQTASNMWLTKGKFSSHIDGYLCSIQE